MILLTMMFSSAAVLELFINNAIIIWRRMYLKYCIYCRTFLGLTADSATDLLHTFVKAVDSCLEEYKLPLYYAVWILFSVTWVMCLYLSHMLLLCFIASDNVWLVQID